MLERKKRLIYVTSKEEGKKKTGIPYPQGLWLNSPVPLFFSVLSQIPGNLLRGHVPRLYEGQVALSCSAKKKETWPAKWGRKISVAAPSLDTAGVSFDAMLSSKSKEQWQAAARQVEDVISES